MHSEPYRPSTRCPVDRPIRFALPMLFVVAVRVLPVALLVGCASGSHGGGEAKDDATGRMAAAGAGPVTAARQAETLKDDVVATPELARALADVDRLTAQVEQVTGALNDQRTALLAAFDDRQQKVDATLASARGTLDDSDRVVRSLGETSRSLKDLVSTTDGLFARYQQYEAAHPPATQPGRPFDVREYTQGVRELSAALAQMNELIKSSNDLLASPEWGAQIQQINVAADGRMRIATGQSQTVVSNTFARVYVAMGVLFVMLILYRVLAYVLVRRLRHADRVHAGAASSSSSLAAAGTSATGAALPRTPGYEAVRDYFYGDPDAVPAHRPARPRTQVSS